MVFPPPTRLLYKRRRDLGRIKYFAVHYEHVVYCIMCLMNDSWRTTDNDVNRRTPHMHRFRCVRLLQMVIMKRKYAV